MSEFFGYAVERYSRCTKSESSPASAGEEYSWHEEYQNEVEAVRKTNTNPDVVSIHDIPVGETAFLVWAEYSTGDSFGWAIRSNVEMLSIFRDYRAAVAASNWYERLREDEDFPICHKERTFTAPDGQVLGMLHAPWEEVFQDLEGIHITEITIS